jgi:hypothetical protein
VELFSITQEKEWSSSQKHRRKSGGLLNNTGGRVKRGALLNNTGGRVELFSIKQEEEWSSFQ